MKNMFGLIAPVFSYAVCGTAAWFCAFPPSLPCLAQEAPGTVPAASAAAPEGRSPGIFDSSSFRSSKGNLPTYIKSEMLTLDSKARIFTYNRNVEVQHEDMVMTCDALQGMYDEHNKIQKMVAQGNVIIEKGETVRASGQRAIYDADAEILTLTESPELQESGSVLTADAIKIFLREDRSSAEGQVRVKVVKKEEAAAKPLGASQPARKAEGKKPKKGGKKKRKD